MIWRLLTFLIMVTGSFQGYAHAGSATLKVMSFNIVLGVHADLKRMTPREAVPLPKDGIPKIVAAIKSTDPDIVALQEVFKSEQARQIADATGLHWRYQAYSEGLPIGQAILSKRSIRSFRSVALPSTRATRQLSLATIQVGGDDLVVAVLHRDHRITDASDYAIVRETLKELQGPVVLAGDFNADFGSVEPLIEQARLTNAVGQSTSKNTSELLRLGTTGSGRTVDHIFVRPDNFDVIDVSLLAPDFRRISDHRAIVATLRVR